VPKRTSSKALSADALDFFRRHGSRGGKKGGAVSWANMTPEQRKARGLKLSRAGLKARRLKARKK
jgi:hypothetical protein